ncbi:hypothetical protein K431DRAFT_277526 [Polychaeton citri CBS 116435]|uniref:PH domain-containing protein n=1 Tax=Polychaeton citri CBS 116435 TaxID=1314669 RepID=A0A9P4UIQ8_9PEZI|nr:hypothetical protein K431DRAFT_277526 [Polychaeton citri CBS 116435]
MSITPFGMSVLGIDPDAQPRRDQPVVEPNPSQAAATAATTTTLSSSPTAERTPTAPAQRPRPPRRPTSNFNAFQTTCTPSTDSPPAYAAAVRHRPSPQPTVDEAQFRAPPKYTCTVSAEAKLLLQVESINPLHKTISGEWKEVYLVLRGTLLCIHKVKDQGPGKLLRSYTLQHAEIGMALDVQHTVLVPQSRLGYLVPLGARLRAAKKDPMLFKVEPQHIMRLRVETDQILLAGSNEERIHSLINAISAGIDIAPVLDERSIPKICTVPRRRRRREAGSVNVHDPSVISEQERIMREMFPNLLGRRTNESGSETSTSQVVANPQLPPVPEDEDLDLSAMREDGGACTTTLSRSESNGERAIRPSASRTTTSSTVNSTFSDDMMYVTNPANFNASGKWEPVHARSPAQIQRYIRRCMPILPADAVRASDVLISNGKRLKINWCMEVLEDWELKPPSYRLHTTTNAVTRSASQRSTAAGSLSANSRTDDQSLSASDDAIEPVEPSTPTQSAQALMTTELHELAKVGSSSSTPEKPTSASSARRQQAEAKRAEGASRDNPYEAPGMIFCF